jgi:tetratricopeptide (TPR) repeat protein
VEIRAKPSPEPRESVALLGKGDSFEKGLAALNEDHFQQAIELFTQAISDIADAFNYRAHASYYLGRYENALRDFDTFLELRPDDAVGMFNKGVTLGALNRNEEAIAVYDQLIERFGGAGEAALREQVAKALLNKGVRLGALNRSEESIAVYDQLIERFGGAGEAALRELLRRVAKAIELSRQGKG